MSGRRAIVFGGTGLIGRALMEELCRSENYEAIIAFTRRKIEDQKELKIENRIVDFGHPESFSGQIIGDDMYICLGTTIRKAGSVKKMEEIDRDLPVTLAKYAHANGIKRLAVVSSIGAYLRSSNYYLRIKGEMEKEISDIDFESIAIARPSLLLGERNEKRFGESFAGIFIRIFGYLLHGRYRKYRAIKGRDVAKALIKIVLNGIERRAYESDELQLISQK